MDFAREGVKEYVERGRGDGSSDEHLIGGWGGGGRKSITFCHGKV